MKRIVALLAAGLFAGTAVGQSYNIVFGQPLSLPSADYAAAGLPGAWNVVGVPIVGEHYPLQNLAGEFTGVTLNNIGGTQLLVADDPATAGDDELLMDEMLIGFNDPVDVCIWINNLPSGPYEVLIYAMTPNTPSLLSRTRVDFADQGPVWIGGAWPGRHEEGVTYSRHTVTVSDGRIGLHSGLFSANVQSGINGIQVRRLQAGDLNGDGCVDFSDLLILLSAYGVDADGDIDADGDTDFEDLITLLGNYGDGDC